MELIITESIWNIGGFTQLVDVEWAVILWQVANKMEWSAFAKPTDANAASEFCEKQRKIRACSIALHFPITPLTPVIRHPEPSESIYTPNSFLHLGFWANSHNREKRPLALPCLSFCQSLCPSFLSIRSSISLYICLSVWLHISA